MTTALLFEGHDVDEVDDWTAELPKLEGDSVLWIDLEDPDEGELERVSEELELASDTAEKLANPGEDSRFGDFERYLHLTVHAPADGREPTLVPISCVVSEHWVVTCHAAPLEPLRNFRKGATGSGETGRLDGLEFLASLLEWVIDSYLDAFEEMERSLEKIDEQAMSGGVTDGEQVVAKLVELRRGIGRLRRALVSHRKTFLALTRPELERIATSESAERFALLRDRLEHAVHAARDSRDSVVGSFDVLIATTGQRTNEIMKVLTLASLLLLPGAVIAGVLGMNFKVGVFEYEWLFWVVVVGLTGAIAAATVAVARVRNWI